LDPKAEEQQVNCQQSGGRERERGTISSTDATRGATKAGPSKYCMSYTNSRTDFGICNLIRSVKKMYIYCHSKSIVWYGVQINHVGKYILSGSLD
jgi:hypothetical protein